jgi:hypothetical protein
MISRCQLPPRSAKGAVTTKIERATASGLSENLWRPFGHCGYLEAGTRTEYAVPPVVPGLRG